MKRIFFICLFVVSSSAIARADWKEIFNASARYTHHPHHARHADRTHLYEPSNRRASPDTTVVKDTWPYLDEAIRYPNASGSTILDAYTGRQPVISATGCGYPDDQMYRFTHSWSVTAWYLR